MKTLEERVRREKDTQNKRHREAYAYARSLGFTSAESRILSKMGKDKIDKVAIEEGKSEAIDVSDKG